MVATAFVSAPGREQQRTRGARHGMRRCSPLALLAALAAGCTGLIGEHGADPGGSNPGGGGGGGGPGAGVASPIDLSGSPQYYRFVRLTNAQWGRSVQDVLNLPAPSGL